jgi:hypothetical protein
MNDEEGKPRDLFLFIFSGPSHMRLVRGSRPPSPRTRGLYAVRGFYAIQDLPPLAHAACTLFETRLSMVRFGAGSGTLCLNLNLHL